MERGRGKEEIKKRWIGKGEVERWGKNIASS